MDIVNTGRKIFLNAFKQFGEEELMKGKKIQAFQEGNFEEILLTLIKGAEENDTKAK